MKKSKPETVPAMPKPDRDYETEGHLRTLMDAEMIKGDPEKMAKVKKLAGRHRKHITSIADLKDTYNEKFGAKAPKED
jgi:hypothetical protein